MFNDHISNLLANLQSLDNLWTEKNILYGVIIIIWITYFWEMYLQLRQYVVCTKASSVPPELAGVMDTPTFTKARLYSLDKAKLTFASKTWDQLVTTAMLLYMVLPWLWGRCGEVLANAGYPGEILQTALFVLAFSVISTLLDLPWSLYSTFVVEARHGFNKQTPMFFLKDQAKKFGLATVLVVPISCAVVQIIRVGGDYFFVYLWVFCTLLLLVMLTIYPDYIAPLFDKYTQLPEGDLHKEIEKMAASLNFPLTKIYIVEGSKRSSHSNAYLYGFHKNKRIVLFDTLLENNPTEAKETSETNEQKKVGCSNDEIMAILAHEFGHWKLSHMVKNLVITQVNMFLVFVFFSLLFKDPTLYRAFGFSSQPIIVGLILVMQYIFSPYNELLSFLIGVLSRRFEFAADHFAKQMSCAADLRSALVKISSDNLSFPLYDWLYSAWHHSHPPLLERLHALGKIE